MCISPHSRVRPLGWLLRSFLLCVLSGCSPKAETAFAPGYTEHKFDMVQIGNDSNRVVELIGPPLRVDHQSFSELWMYGTHPNVHFSNGLFIKQGTIPIPKLVVYFGSDGLVKSIYGDEGVSLQLQGKDKDTVRAALGLPAETKTNKGIFIFSYTEGKHSESFDVRAVIFNEQGRVLEKKSFYYRD